MKRILVALAAVAILAAVPAGAEERMATPGSHLVTSDLAQARLQERSADRERNLATVESLLSSPEGAAGLKMAGVSEARVKAALPTLTDAELQDVAARAAALQADPVAAGLTTHQWIWIAVGVAAIVILIIALA